MSNMASIIFLLYKKKTYSQSSAKINDNVFQNKNTTQKKEKIFKRCRQMAFYLRKNKENKNKTTDPRHFQFQLKFTLCRMSPLKVNARFVKIKLK